MKVVLDSPVEGIREVARRKRAESIEHRSQLASKLRREGKRMLLSGESVHCYVLVTLDGDGCPSIDWDGVQKWQDLRTAELAIHDALYSDEPKERVKSMHERRVSYRAECVERDRQKKADTPWLCDHCARRFRTERGALQHELWCDKSPDPAVKLRRLRRDLRKDQSRLAEVMAKPDKTDSDLRRIGLIRDRIAERKEQVAKVSIP